MKLDGKTTLLRLQQTIDRRCESYDFPASTARRKARRLYYILVNHNPRGAALRNASIKLQRCHSAAATFFESITVRDRI